MTAMNGSRRHRTGPGGQARKFAIIGARARDHSHIGDCTPPPGLRASVSKPISSHRYRRRNTALIFREPRRIRSRVGRQVPVELSRDHPVVDRATVDPEPPRELRLRNSLVEIVLQQHPDLSSVHPCPVPVVVTSPPQPAESAGIDKLSVGNFEPQRMRDLRSQPTHGPRGREPSRASRTGLRSAHGCCNRRARSGLPCRA